MNKLSVVQKVNQNPYIKPVSYEGSDYLADLNQQMTKGISSQNGVVSHLRNDNQPVKDTCYSSNGYGDYKYGNPKINIPPLMVARSHDLDEWKMNNLITHSAVNTQTQEENYLSGYAVSNCCDNKENKHIVNHGTSRNMLNTNIVNGVPYGIKLPINGYTTEANKNIKENFTPLVSRSNVNTCQGAVAPTPSQYSVRIPTVQENFTPLVSRSNVNTCQGAVAPTPSQYSVRIPTVQENFETVRPNESGWVNVGCSYNPSNLTVNLPSNYAGGNCQQSDVMSEYNKNLFTQHVGSDAYSVNQITEPINDNIGISYNQVLNPIVKKYNENGTITYTEHDPRVFDGDYYESYQEEPTRDNVYDPRLTNYGTSYRSYVDPVLGQPRYAYDDVDAVRAPNYICRSNIDHLPFAQGIGVGDNYDNVELNSNIRNLVQGDYFDQTNNFRADLQESLMRKVNANLYQQRQFPIRNNQWIH